MYIYETLLTKESIHQYMVTIPDFCTSFTLEGEREKAIELAAECLKTAIQAYLALGKDVPDPQRIVVADPNAEVVVMAIEVLPPYDDLVTVEQAMHILNVSQPRIAHLLRDGRLRALSHGRRKLITRESLEAYLATPRTAGRPKKDYSYEFVKLDPPEQENEE